MRNLPGSMNHSRGRYPEPREGRDYDNECDRLAYPYHVDIPQTMNDQHEKDTGSPHRMGAPIPNAQRGNADWEPEARLI